MSLGQQIAPWLPSLRIYAAALAGEQSLGDVLVRHMLESIVDNPKSFPQALDARVALARCFENVSSKVELEGVSLADGTISTILRTDSRHALMARKSALLAAVLGYTVEEISFILGVSLDDVIDTLDRTATKLGRMPPRRILVAEPDAIIAQYIMSRFKELGHDIVGWATDERLALDMALDLAPDFIITETRLPLDPNGADNLISRIRARRPIDGVILSGLPEDHFKSEPFVSVGGVVAKPARFSILEIALYLASGGPGLAANLPQPAASLENETQAAIVNTEPVAFAPSAKVVNSIVELVHEDPRSSSPVVHLDVLRLDHAEEARRLLVVGHNLGTSYTSRLSKLSDLLDQPLTDETALRIANQVQALASFERVIEAELLPLQSADTLSFIRSLDQFARQFPAWREFLIAAESMPAIKTETAEAAQQLAAALTDAPGLLSDEIREVITEARAVEADAPSEVGQRYLIGVVRNVYAAIARWCMARAGGVTTRFNDQFDEKVGDALVDVVGNLILVAGAPLAVMATTLPKEFIWVGPALAALRSLKPNR